jgi:putative SOS response-associated peptidase YedK
MDEWKDKASGETLKSCTMIITEPNKFVAEVHDRMPVLLAERDYKPWLSGNAGLDCSSPPPKTCYNAGRFQNGSIARGRRTMIRRRSTK